MPPHTHNKSIRTPIPGDQGPDYAPQCQGVESCLWEKEKKDRGFFSAELLKIIGIVYTIASPLVVWLVVSTFTMQSDIKLIQQRQEVIMEIRQDINTIKVSLQEVKQDVAILKARTP